MGKQCWSQAVLESGSWGHSVLQTPALVFFSSKISQELLQLEFWNLGQTLGMTFYIV